MADVSVAASEAARGLLWSLAARDWSRGTAFYERALNDAKRLRHKFSIQERRMLIQVLWEVALEMDGPSIAVRGTLVDLLSSLLKKKVKELLADGLTLPWKPLFDAVNLLLFDSTPNLVDYSGPVPLTYLSHFLRESYIKLVARSRRLFPKESSAELFHELEPLLCIHHNEIIRAQYLLDLFLNCDTEPSWLNRAMEISRLVPNSVTLTSISCHTLSRTAIAHFGDLFQFWEENSSEIFTNILASLQLAIGDSPESVPPVTIPVSLLQYTSSLFNMGMQYAAKWIIYSLNHSSGETSIYARLVQLLHQIKTFFHPSNQGSYTNNLTYFLYWLVIMVNRRVTKQKEMDSKEAHNPFTEERINELIELFLPLALNVVFSSNTKIGCRTIALLAQIKPEMVFSKVIERIYYGLNTDTAAHQIAEILELLSHLINSTITSNLFAQHFAQLLQQTLPAIDLNDSTKTYSALKFHLPFLAHVPLFESISLSSSTDELFQNRGQVVAMIGDWAILFLERVFDFLQHREAKSKTHTSSSAEFFEAVFKRVFQLFFMQSSPHLHEMATKKLVEYVRANVVKNSTKEFGQLLNSAVHANPVIGLKIAFSLVDSIKGKGKTLKGSDPKNTWTLQLLSKAVRHAGVHILPYLCDMPVIQELVAASFEDPNKKDVTSSGMKLLRGALKCMTTKYPLDYRSLNKADWDTIVKTKNHVQHWGTFEKSSFQIETHIPNATEISATRDLIKHFSELAFSGLDPLLTSIEDKSDYSLAGLSLYLRLLRGILRGGAMAISEPMSADEIRASVFENDASANAHEHGFADLKRVIDINEGLPEDVRDKDLRPRVGQYCHKIAALFSRNTKEQHFLKPMRHLAQLLSAILTRRDVAAGKADSALQHFNAFKSMLKNKFQPNSPLPRCIYVEKAHVLYLLRADSCLTSLTQTATTKCALEDLLTLFLVHSESLASFRINVMNALKLYPRARAPIVTQLILNLSNKDKSEAEMTASIQVLGNLFSLREIMRDWKLIALFTEHLLASDVHQDPKIQALIFALFSQFVQEFVREPPRENLSKIQLSKFPMGTDPSVVESIKKFHAMRNSNNSAALVQITNKLQSLIDNPQPHWRYELIAVGIFCTMFLQDPLNEVNRSRLQSSIRSLIRLLDRADLAIVRTIAIHAIFSGLSLLKSLSRRPQKIILDRAATVPATWTLPPSILGGAENDDEFNKFVFIDKMHLGWNDRVSSVILERSIIEEDEESSLNSLLAAELFHDSNNSDSMAVSRLENIIRKMENDHNLSEAENEEQHEDQNVEDALSSAASMNLSAEAIAGQLGSRGENTQLLNGLLKSDHDHNHVLNAPVIGTESAFNLTNANFFLRISAVLKNDFIKKAIPLVAQMIESNERAKECVAFELFAGVLRSLKLLKAHELRMAMEQIRPVMLLMRDFPMSKFAQLDAVIMFRWACLNRDPRRFGFLLDFFLPSSDFQGPCAEGRSSQLQAQNLFFINALVETFSWRAAKQRDVILDYLLKNMNNESNQVREALAAVLKSVFSLSYHPDPAQDRTVFVRELARQVPMKPTSRSQIAFVQSALLFFSFAVDDVAPFANYLEDILSPAFALQIANEEETRDLAKAIVGVACQVLLSAEQFEAVLANVLSKTVQESDSWRVRGPVTFVLPIMLFNHSYRLTAAAKAHVQSIIVKLISDENREVSFAAKDTLASATKISSDATLDYIEMFSKLLATPMPKKKQTTPQPAKKRKRDESDLDKGDEDQDVHSEDEMEVDGDDSRRAAASFSGGRPASLLFDPVSQKQLAMERKKAKTKQKQEQASEVEEAIKSRSRGALGLSALIEAHPYSVPSWMPQVLEELTRHLRDPSPIDTIVREVLKEFWRTHQDEWPFFAAQFTLEQQEAIKQSPLPSYFA